MPAYDEYPQFDGLSSSEMLHLIIEARLSRTDIQIAASRLVWGMEYKRNPEHATRTLDAWKAIHANLLAETAEVRAIIEGFE